MLRFAPRTAVLSLACFAFACKGSGETEPAAPRAPDPGTAGDGDPEPGPAPAPNPVAFDEVEYRFQDASVPPPHHRSVTITAKAGSILRVVDSYGDEIERQESPLSDEQFRELVDTFAKAGVRPRDDGIRIAECTGGTRESVRLSHQGEQVFSGTIDHCGGSHASDFQGDLDPFISAIKSRAGGGPVAE